MPSLSYVNYTPSQAVTEYQQALIAQRHADHKADMAAPMGTVATYSLSGRLPNWELLLSIEKPHVWSKASLTAAVQVLAQPDLLPGAPAAKVSAQLAAFEAELLTRN